MNSHNGIMVLNFSLRYSSNHSGIFKHLFSDIPQFFGPQFLFRAEILTSMLQVEPRQQV